MKRIFLILTFLFSISAFAQDLREGLKAKNDGNEAFKRNDYIQAIANWEKYFASGEKVVSEDLNTQFLYVSSFKYAASEFLKKQDYDSAFLYYEKYNEKGGAKVANDSISIFNMAFAAKKLKKNDVALSLFKKSIDFGYKADRCKLYVADIYQESGYIAKMKEVLITAILQHPDSKYLKEMTSMLIKPLLKDAAIPFNSANELAKRASSENQADYLTTMTLSCAKFNEAIPLFENVLKYDPQNELALTYLRVCQDNIKSFNEYKADPSKR